MIQELLREDRLALWDRLIQGELIDQLELNQLVTKFVHAVPVEERIGCALLLAATNIASQESRAMRRNLVAALRYWFSHTGSKIRPPDLDPYGLKDAGLIELMGLYLSWPEAMLSVGGNPDDYTALKRVERKLKEKYEEEWDRVFGSSAPLTFAHGGEKNDR